jgi:uncharacterized protein (UPF0179 family)
MTAISPTRNNYVAIAATSSSTFGTVGAYLHSVVVNVQTNTEATCIVSDNGVTLVSIPATQAAGVYVIPLEVATKGAITATCSGNSNCRVVGLFSDYV